MKMFGLAALAAVASMAMLGAGTASATDTALCQAHEEECAGGNQLELIHVALTSGTVGRLLSNLATILCLNVLGVGHVEKDGDGKPIKLANPLPLDLLLTFESCGSNASHNNCTVTVKEQPLALLLRTALNLGTLSGHAGKPGRVELECTIIGITIRCDYSGEKLSFPVEGALHQGNPTGRGMITANETPATLTEALGGAGFLCPENSRLDGLLEPLPNHVYIMK